LLESFGETSGHDAPHRCGAGLFLQSISIPQVPPFREDLFCRSLHGRPQLEVEVHREAVTAIGETYKFIRAGGGKVILA
jgi:hypothetical protein